MSTRWFAGAGAALVAAQIVLIWATRGLDNDAAEAFGAVMPLIVGLAVPAAVAFFYAPRLAHVTPSRVTIGILLVVGLALRLVWFGQVPPVETDYQRYMWDGGLVAHGHDPYRYPPLLFKDSDGAEASPTHRDLAKRAPHVLKDINFPDMRTIYPSVAQAAFGLGHLLAPFKVDGLRIVFLLAELATCLLLMRLLGDMGRNPLWAALYWWNPLSAYMTVAIAHVDALVPPFVLAALLFTHRQRPYAALAMLGLGAGVKIWPLILAPLILAPYAFDRARRDWRVAITGLLVITAVLAFAVGPVVLSALRPGSGLTAYSEGWSMNNAPFAWAAFTIFKLTGSWDTAQAALRPVVALGTAGIAIWAGLRGDATLPSLATRALIVSAAVFYLSPAQFPWYAVWFLPLAALVQNWPLLFASVVLPAYFFFFPLWARPGGPDLFFYGVAFIHALPVFAWLAWTGFRARADVTSKA